jgi:2-polyprenyl-3-methyl-5-hydroxy-6-metoxy-1,4-benzoquinol methylase
MNLRMSFGTQPSPALFFDTVNAYQKTAALKAAIELDIFTQIAHRAVTARQLAEACKASLRGIEILCDYLVTRGFLRKVDGHYELTQDSDFFLNRESPAYLGGTLEFLHSHLITEPFDDLAETVRKGRLKSSELGTLAPDHPVWVKFARAMAPLMMGPAMAVAELLKLDEKKPVKILDVAASHGAYGISVASKSHFTELFGLDWAPVLEVAHENAEAAGLGDRFKTLAGNAFEVDIGNDYDVILIPNFLHHFNREECVRLLKKATAALKPGGRVVVVEFVPNPDRVSPSGIADFSLVMLATTPQGRAYTFPEFESMMIEAGLKNPSLHPLPPSLHSAVIGTR